MRLLEKLVVSPVLPQVSPEMLYSSFARRLVRDVLEREPSVNDVHEIVDSLYHGVSRRRVVMRLLCSTERRERQVRAYYQHFLRREPSADGLTLWIGFLNAGRWQEEILGDLLSSKVYYQVCNNSVEGFVRGLYRDCLHRRAEESEVAAVAGLLQAGSATRRSLAHSFLSGEEFRRNLICEWHERFLKKQASPRKISQWLFKMQHHSAQEHVQAALLSSREYLRETLR